MTQTYGDLGLNKYRKQITGHKKGMRIRKFLLMNSKKMDYFIKREFEKWLLDYPELREIYYAKETLHNHYFENRITNARTEGYNNVCKQLQKRNLFMLKFWLREQDSNLRPSGYEPDELPDCSIPR